MVASVGLFLYFRYRIIEGAEIVEPEAIPVKNYVESCMDLIAKDGLTTLGLNGGYIEFPAEIENDPKSYLPSGPIVDLKNPYWWYDGKTNIPTESGLKKQISDYVTNQLKECIDDFNDFSNEFNIEELGKIVTTAEINENDVAIKTTYPILITNKVNDTKTKLSRYKVTIPVRLKQVHELAKAITEREIEDGFIEERTIDLMALNDKEGGIPLNNMEVKCGNIKWFIPDVKGRLKEMLRTNLPYIKIAGTEYSENSYMPIPDFFSEEKKFNSSYFHYHYIWDVSEKNYEDMHVTFEYDERWPLKLYARPSKGQYLESNAQKGFDILKFFCLHIWHFTYDISYPVKVTIADDQAKDHMAYTFSFAFKTAINHNQVDRANLASSVFEADDILPSEEYCNDLYNEITVYTEDDVDGLELTDVDLTFTCGGFKCDIGKTGWLGFGAGAGITKRFPYCVNGILRGNKQGYGEGEMFIQTNVEGNAFSLPMTPVKSMGDYVVVKHLISDEVVSSKEEILGENEKATITISKINGEFESYGVYPTEQPYPITLLSKDDFTYELAVYLFKDDNAAGGYKGNWTVSWEELKNAEQIKFHVIEKNIKDPEEGYLLIAGLGSYSKDVPKPELR